MPPSPSLRRSPGVENRGDIHKRGRSLESGLSFKGRDDDLALFNEMQTRETDNFLLQPTDDFDDILSSRVKSFPDFKLGITIPARGESSDLLNADGKNDYDWLLTPPDTPLFPSLDDEPEPVNVIHSGRERSRPISISRTSTMERSQRSSRGSPSPQRLSPSPRSGGGSFSGRPSSAPHASATPIRSSTPTRRPSPPPLKPSTPPPRASTPPSRRTSVGPLGLRGSSPARTTRGNSSSPKVKAWQSNIPGFSLEAPPNLRTSLSDRPVSYVRGSSPASRTSPSRRGPQSMSPTASRSISSSHSHERVSVASSGDDDADSMHSLNNLSNRPVSGRGVGGLSNSRPVAFSKKSGKTFSPSSAPKRSFDSAMRQLDRKNPQNMFRPLLSSVPSSTFYSGKATGTHHRTMISRNSSVTTSSNASSDQATSGAHDTEGSDHYHDEMTSDNNTRTPFSNIHDEAVFVINDPDPKTRYPSSEFQHGKSGLTGVCSSHPDDSKEAEVQVCNELNVTISVCVRCGLEYLPNDLIESEDNLCTECMRKEGMLTNPKKTYEQNATESIHVEESTFHDCSNDPPRVGGESGVVIPEKSGQSPSNVTKRIEKSHSNVEITEGAGISVLLLKRSNSAKAPLIHGKTFNSSAISYDDLSYARDLASSMRSSTTSSIDLASARQMLIQQHLSGKKSSDTSSKPQSTVSSFSTTSIPVFQALGASTSSHEETIEGSVTSVSHIVDKNGSSDEVLALVNAESEEVDESGKSEALLVHDEVHVQDSVDEDTKQNIRTLQLNNQNDEKERVEDELHSLSSTSEIELGHSHPSSPRSQVDTVSREDLVDPTAVTCTETDAKGGIELDTTDGIIEESMVTVEDPGGRRTRSLTLEEATDTILFCSSIIHDIAFTAATIAIEKEKENLEPLEGSRPTVTIPDKHNFDIKDPPRSTKGQKIRRRRAETEQKQPLTNNDEMSITERSNDENSVVQNVGIPKNGDSMKPPKVESKCNCTIM